MKAIILIAAMVVTAGLSGCGHKTMRGSVAMKTSDTDAHVCMGKGEVAKGDRVTLFRNVCRGVGTGVGEEGGGGSCEKKDIGMGTVQDVLNEHYSVVRFDQGVKFEEGTFVEKK